MINYLKMVGIFAPQISVKKMRQELQEYLMNAGGLLTAQGHERMTAHLKEEEGIEVGGIPFMPANFFEQMLGQVASRHTAILSHLTIDQIKDPKNLSEAERTLLMLNSARDAKRPKDVVIAAYDPNDGAANGDTLGAVMPASDLYQTQLFGVMMVHPLILSDKDLAPMVYGHENAHAGQYGRGLMGYQPDQFKKSAWVQMHLMLEGEAFPAGLAWLARRGQWNVMQEMLSRRDAQSPMIRVFADEISAHDPGFREKVEAGKPIRDEKILAAAALKAREAFFDTNNPLFLSYVSNISKMWEMFVARSRHNQKPQADRDVPAEFWQKIGLPTNKIDHFRELGHFPELDAPPVYRRRAFVFPFAGYKAVDQAWPQTANPSPGRLVRLEAA